MVWFSEKCSPLSLSPLSLSFSSPELSLPPSTFFLSFFLFQGSKITSKGKINGLMGVCKNESNDIPIYILSKRAQSAIFERTNEQSTPPFICKLQIKKPPSGKIIKQGLPLFGSAASLHRCRGSSGSSGSSGSGWS